MPLKKSKIILLSFILGACSSSVTQEEVIGKYISNEKAVKNVLIINSDHTYTHIFIDKKGDKYENKSIWAFSKISDNLAIEFTSYYSSVWIVEIEKDIFGTIKLCFDPDLYLCYIKQSTRNLQ